MNQITIKGRLTRDPEMRQTQSGVPVCSYSVAVPRRFSKTNEVDFIDCSSWKNNAEFVNNYFKKGKEILVSGSMESRRWTDKDGNNRISWELKAQEQYFCGSNTDKDDQEEQAPWKN